MIKQQALKWERPSEVLPGMEKWMDEDFALVGETDAEWKKRASAIEEERARRAFALSNRRQMTLFRKEAHGEAARQLLAKFKQSEIHF